MLPPPLEPFIQALGTNSLDIVTFGGTERISIVLDRGVSRFPAEHVIFDTEHDHLLLVHHVSEFSYRFHLFPLSTVVQVSMQPDPQISADILWPKKPAA